VPIETHPTEARTGYSGDDRVSNLAEHIVSKGDRMSDLPIPWIDLRPQTRAVEEHLEGAWAPILESGAFSNGPETARFEEEWARYVGVRHAVGTSDGTSSILLLLRAAGLGPGDEVLTAPTSYFATAEAIALSGARPSFADVDPETGNLDPASVESRIGPRTRAIVAVHLTGRLADVPALRAIAASRGLRLFEDAAQAHGARLGERRAGSLADAASFSFYPTKNLGAFGEGGAVTTNDDGIAARVRSLRDHGQSSSKHRHELIGHNARLDSIQASVLRIKLRLLDGWNAERRALADAYRERLAGVPVAVPPRPDPPEAAVYHLFTVRTECRDDLAKHLADRRIGTGSHYPTPIHLQPAFAALGYGPGSFPNAELYARQQLSLPLYPGMPGEFLERVCSAIQEFFARPRAGATPA
jgi:dTDP-4-amino-4,6-dideoxygalactose transaminase